MKKQMLRDHEDAVRAQAARDDEWDKRNIEERDDDQLPAKCRDCGLPLDETQDYAEIDDGADYLCEACADKAGIEITHRT
jgi:hypothetical protein